MYLLRKRCINYFCFALTARLPVRFTKVISTSLCSRFRETKLDIVCPHREAIWQGCCLNRVELAKRNSALIFTYFLETLTSKTLH